MSSIASESRAVRAGSMGTWRDHPLQAGREVLGLGSLGSPKKKREAVISMCRDFCEMD